MANFYTITRTVNGKEYTFQYGGMSLALRSIDETYLDGTNTTSLLKRAKFMFEHIVVEPKGLTVDDFDDMEELQEVIGIANDVMQGNFREEANKATTGKQNKK